MIILLLQILILVTVATWYVFDVVHIKRCHPSPPVGDPTPVDPEESMPSAFKRTPSFLDGTRCVNCNTGVDPLVADRISLLLPMVGGELPVAIFLCEECMLNA